MRAGGLSLVRIQESISGQHSPESRRSLCGLQPFPAFVEGIADAGLRVGVFLNRDAEPADLVSGFLRGELYLLFQDVAVQPVSAAVMEDDFPGLGIILSHLPTAGKKIFSRVPMPEGLPGIVAFASTHVPINFASSVSVIPAEDDSGSGCATSPVTHCGVLAARLRFCLAFL